MNSPDDLPTGCSCSNGTCTDCARDMRAALLRIRQLHRPIQRSRNGIQVCKACTETERIGMPHNPNMAGVAHPCATYLATEIS